MSAAVIWFFKVNNDVQGNPHLSFWVNDGPGLEGYWCQTGAATRVDYIINDIYWEGF
jgi:hypothetical protein